MPIELGFDVDTSDFERFIDRLDSTLDPQFFGPMQQGLEGASDVYMESMRERFAQYSNRGGDWAEHAPSTIKKRGAGAPILNEEGDLEESLKRGAPDHVLEHTSDGVREGTENAVARYQQSGTEHIPAREFIVPPDADTLAGMKHPLTQGLKDAVREAGR